MYHEVAGDEDACRPERKLEEGEAGNRHLKSLVNV